MLKLKDYLTEEKNVHMEHADDLIFNEGVNGLRKAINFIRDLRDMLAGHATSKISVTVKWDGAPAIFAGVDPSDNKFFVAKKGLFNVTPKLYKTQHDIDAELSGELHEKFSIALAELSKLGIKSGVYQGDLMFTNSDLKKESIGGEEYVTFHPNTIVYAVPLNSELGRKIRKARIGVVWHTTYVGKDFSSMRASFGQSIVDKFKKSTSVWMDDATYKDYSGVATLTQGETAKLDSVLTECGRLFKAVNADVINYISRNPELMMMVKTYNNSKIRAGETISDTMVHVEGLFHYIYDRYQKEIDSKKTQQAKASWEAKRKGIMAFFVEHPKAEIARIFDLANYIAEAKAIIINKMNEAGHIKTFLKTNSGFKVTGVEGYVAIDHLSGGAVKIVDRMEFSKANFSADVLKGWQR